MKRLAVFVVLGGCLVVADTVQAVRIPLYGRAAQKSFAGPGCGTQDSVAVSLPADARAIRPFEGFSDGSGGRSGGWRVGDPVFGPDGFNFEGAIGVPDYATVSAFGVAPVATGFTATFTVAPTARWCAGYFTAPDGSPAPASSVSDPQTRPGYHAGWRTAPHTLMLRFVVNRQNLYTRDTRGVLRSRPPARLAISRRHPLQATGLRWRRWGQPSAIGDGSLRHRGRRLAVRVEFYNAELNDPDDGCPAGRVYYRNLAVSVPAWRKKTTYAIGNRCRTMVVNNAAGDLRPPA
ncbi:MAG TPA: hypothetical protein VFZ89_05240 [Solirubrobacteraceae bacterium]